MLLLRLLCEVPLYKLFYLMEFRGRGVEILPELFHPIERDVPELPFIAHDDCLKAQVDLKSSCSDFAQ